MARCNMLFLSGGIRLSLSMVLMQVFHVAAYSQTAEEITYYTGKHGLAHHSVSGITKDDDGFIWLGTWNGISRFDGLQFKAIIPATKGGEYLENRRVFRLISDQSDHLWIQTYDKKVYWYDKQTEQFHSLNEIVAAQHGRPVQFDRLFKTESGVIWISTTEHTLYGVPENRMLVDRLAGNDLTVLMKFRLSSSGVNFLHEDMEGAVWIGGTAGLSRCAKTADGKFELTEEFHGVRISRPIKKIAEGRGHLYFVAGEGLLITYDKQTKVFAERNVSKSPINEILHSAHGAYVYLTTLGGHLLRVGAGVDGAVEVLWRGSAELDELFEDSKGNLWMGTGDAAVLLFDIGRQTFTRFPSPVGTKAVVVRFACFEDMNRRVWVVIPGGGFGYYDETTRQIRFATEALGSTQQVAFPKLVYKLYYDAATQVAWLCSEDRGLGKLTIPGDDLHFRGLPQWTTEGDNQEVRSMLVDSRQRLWMGTKSGELFISESGKMVEPVLRGRPTGGFGSVYALMEDRQGVIWIGTKTEGIYRAIPMDDGSYRLCHYHVGNSSLVSNQIYAFLEGQQGEVWVASFDSGLIKAETGGGAIDFKRIPFDPAGYPKGSFDKIRHLSMDDVGNIWLATTHGLLVYRPGKASSYRVYRQGDPDGCGLGDNDIHYLIRSGTGDMWLCTAGGGLTKASGNPFGGLTFTNYTAEDGLANGYIVSGVEDRQGHLWMATEGGVSRFDPVSEKFFNRGLYDGTPGFRFSEKTVVIDSSGMIHWGTTRGLLSLNPLDKYFHRVEAKMVFTNLLINNKVFRPQPGIPGQERNVQYLDELILRHDQNNVSVDFAITDFRYRHHDYRYRLLGLDTNWHYSNQLNRATFTNLAPGRYSLEVQYENSLLTTQPAKRLRITVLPPWWHTGWAYAIYAVVTVIVALMVWRTVLTMLRLKHKIAVERRLAAIKVGFFTNVSHELRTPLTLILSPIKQLIETERLTPAGKRYAETIRRNALRMEGFVDQLLDLRRMQEKKYVLNNSDVDLVGLVRTVLANFGPLAHEKNNRLIFNVDVDCLYVYLDAAKMEIVLYNLLSNALKFAPPHTAITVTVGEDGKAGGVLITVSDEGPGVEADALEDIFELFHVADSTADTTVPSSGVGLSLAKEIVMLHGGNISAANNPGGGLSVNVWLPQKLRVGCVATDIPSVETTNGKSMTVGDGLGGNSRSVVLLVEDNVDLREFLTLQLNGFYDVQTAKDGAEGYKKAKQLLPDLIVSDVMMPRLDGFGMLKKLRDNADTSHIPIVLLTARAGAESHIEGLRCGADHYLTKPFDAEILKAAVDNLLRQRKQLFEAMVGRKMLALKPSTIVINDKDERFLKEVIAVVEEKMADPAFNIDMVAEGLNMGRNTFYKKFKSLTKLTPVEFVRDMRLERAKSYFNAGSSNVSEVAYLVGFNNPKYFSTCFREKFDISPKEYVQSRACDGPIEARQGKKMVTHRHSNLS